MMRVRNGQNGDPYLILSASALAASMHYPAGRSPTLSDSQRRWVRSGTRIRRQIRCRRNRGWSPCIGRRCPPFWVLATPRSQLCCGRPTWAKVESACLSGTSGRFAVGGFETAIIVTEVVVVGEHIGYGYPHVYGRCSVL